MPSSFFPTWFSDVIRRGRRTDKQKCHDHDGQKEETNTHCGLPEPPNVTSTVPSDWKYISEGGATAVFSYIGPHHNMFNGTVLRLRKSGSVSNSEKDDPSIAFQNQCISRLIPSIHLANLRPVHVTTIWLVEFARFHEKHRPAQRRSLAGIDTARTHAVVANDLVGSSPLVVEIKVSYLVFLRQTSLITIYSPNGPSCLILDICQISRVSRNRTPVDSVCTQGRNITPEKLWHCTTVPWTYSHLTATV